MDREVSNHWTQGKLGFPHDHISTQLQVLPPLNFTKPLQQIIGLFTGLSIFCFILIKVRNIFVGHSNASQNYFDQMTILLP